MIDPEVARHERQLALLEGVRNGEWLDAQVFAPLAWAVPGVIPEGLGLLVGPPKLGKSWMALGIGLSVAAGGRALGRIPVGDARPVLYLALEDGHRRLQDRCRTLLIGERIPAKLNFVTRATPADVVDLIDGWLEIHEGKNPLVLLDTLGKVQPPAMPGESAYSRDYRIGGTLKALADRRPGSTLLVVHHTRKAGSEDWMDSTSGTNGLNGAADFTIALTRARSESEAVLKVTGRDVPEGEYALTTKGGAWALVGDLEESATAARTMAATVGLGDRSASIAELVNGSEDGMRAADVALHLNLPAKDASTYLARLAEEGRITRISRGLYGSRLARVIPLHAPSGGVESVVSVVSGTDQNHTYNTDHTYLCDACGQPLGDLDIRGGHNTHASCPEVEQ